MNPDTTAFENLAFNQLNLETVLLSEVVDPMKTYSNYLLLI